MSKQITFADLEKLLLDLGFVSNPVSGTQQVFVYPDLDILVILPGYNKKDMVHPAHLVSTRKILSENGLMDTDVFNELCSSSKVSA
jgi:predicted RNA binding protein YcfA (HicA-like mRNA interferase family)